MTSNVNVPQNFLSPRTLNKTQQRALKEQMLNQIQMESSMKKNLTERQTQSRLAQRAADQTELSASQQVVGTRKMLRCMFDSYALIGNRMDVDTIQSQKYHKIMRDACIYS